MNLGLHLKEYIFSSFPASKVEDKNLTIPSCRDRCENITKIVSCYTGTPLFETVSYFCIENGLKALFLWENEALQSGVLPCDSLHTHNFWKTLAPYTYFFFSHHPPHWLPQEGSDFCVVSSHQSCSIWTLLREAAVCDNRPLSCHGSHHQESGKVQDDKLKAICHCQLHGIKGKTNCICFGKWWREEEKHRLLG